MHESAELDDDVSATGQAGAGCADSSNTSAVSRRKFLTNAAFACPGALIAVSAHGKTGGPEFSESRDPGSATRSGSTDVPLTIGDIEAAERVIGLEFTDADRSLMLEDVQERLDQFAALRASHLENSDVPALLFDPTVGGKPPETLRGAMNWDESQDGGGMLDEEDLAFAGVARLAGMLRRGTVTSTQLTELVLRRIAALDPLLHAVITVTKERALEQAAKADREIRDGRFRSPLHGVPYGAKDLLAVGGYPTTWGAEPFKHQVLEKDAYVVSKLDDAGAILTAKLSLGALAWGDVWFGAKTRNPWNVDEGSSGSSAGPGSAVSAGIVPFAIGSETYGSIVSPSTRNGITGFRPTFGLVGRTGAMTLSWSMDKLGPMCRSALDCALVFDSLRGADPGDPASIEAPFPFDPTRDPQSIRVGYYQSAFQTDEDYDNREADLATLEVLRSSLGLDVIPVELPADLPIDEMTLVLSVEAAAAFDELTRTRGTDSMVRQERHAWPNVFRHSRLIPAVEYVQANRLRVVLSRRMADVFRSVDVVVCPTSKGKTLAMTNLSGHPAVCVPNNFIPVEGGEGRMSPRSITFVANLYRDVDALHLAHAYQSVTDFHQKRPPVS
jgi:Asp-tRNA(Asn)/Glu-tRNA(Gln) amidotransferase A subunit family amidase